MEVLPTFAVLAHAAFTLGVVYFDESASTRTLLLVLISSFTTLVAVYLYSAARKKSIDNTHVVRTESFSRKFSVSIIDIRYHNGKVEYLLKGQYNSFVWTSWKRYSALRKLKPFLPEAVKFPSKTSFASYFAGNEYDLRFVEQRRQELNIMFTKYVNKDMFENGIPDSVREEALGVPVDSIEIEKASLSCDQVMKEAMIALDMASQCATSINPANAATTGEGWQMYGKNKTEQVCGYIKETNDFTFFSARGTVDRFTKEQVLQFVTNASKRAKWDEGFKFEQLLQSFDVSTLNDNDGAYELLKLDVYRTATSSPAKQFVAERDSVCLTVQAKRKSDGALFHCFRSVSHSQAPAGMEGYVRAIVFCAGFVIENRMDGDAGCVLTSVGMVDPVGKIPKWVIALALKNNTWQPWTMISQQTTLE